MITVYRTATIRSPYKKYHISEKCEYDRSPHKMHYMRCRSTKKKIMFLNLYMIATIIAIIFIMTATMIAVFTKMSYI